jgi:hypothetical protein
MLDVLAAAEPGLDRIMTWNAQANDHMIAVNEALGYAVAGQPGTSCQVDVTTVLGRPV